jgi:small subunit ribosomal protein S8
MRPAARLFETIRDVQVVFQEAGKRRKIARHHKIILVKISKWSKTVMSCISDPISDMLTRMRNAIKAGHLKVDIPSSKMKISIARILKDEGFIKNYKLIDDNKQKILRVYLKYTATNQSAILNIRRISKPGRRVYFSAGDLRPVFNNVGIWILSTSKGIITNKAARKMNVGGEVVCEIS